MSPPQGRPSHGSMAPLCPLSASSYESITISSEKKKEKRIHTPLRLRNLPDLLSLCPRPTRWFLHLHLPCLYISVSHSRYLQVAQGHGPVSHAPIVRRVWYMQHSWGKHTGIRRPHSILPRSSREDLVYFQCNLRGVLIKPLLGGY